MNKLIIFLLSFVFFLGIVLFDKIQNKYFSNSKKLEPKISEEITKKLARHKSYLDSFRSEECQSWIRKNCSRNKLLHENIECLAEIINLPDAKPDCIKGIQARAEDFRPIIKEVISLLNKN